MRRFLALCDALQVMDVDRDTLGEAANLADAERLVIAAIQGRDSAAAVLNAAEAALARATKALGRAEAELGRAERALARAETSEGAAAAHRWAAAAARDVAAASHGVDAARERARAARDEYAFKVRSLVNALRYAAECADRLRRGLRRRHGGIAAAAQAAPAPMANRDFYQ